MPSSCPRDWLIIGRRQSPDTICYACRVRREAVAASGVTDSTDHLPQTLDLSQQRRLIERRLSDLAAVAMALETDSQACTDATPATDGRAP